MGSTAPEPRCADVPPASPTPCMTSDHTYSTTMTSYSPKRNGAPLDAELAEQLRARIQELGADRVFRASGISPLALAQCAAASHVLPGTVARLRAYLALRHEGIGPGQVT